MVDAKRKKIKYRVSYVLFYAYMFLFPFGVLLTERIRAPSGSVNFHPIELVALLISIIFFKEIVAYVMRSKILPSFILLIAFSFIFSLSLFSLSQLIVGSLFLLRLYAILGLFVFLKNSNLRKHLRSILLIWGGAIATIGWFQYLLYPNLVDLKYIGWDDHLFRLVGSFLDPAFTGILLVLFSILLLGNYGMTKKKIYLLLGLLAIISLGFTYSRASYLSLALGLVVLYITQEKHAKKATILIFVSFLLLIIILPRRGGEGVRLERTVSIDSRISNYSQTFKIFKRSPLFGVGYNNLCASRNMWFKNIDPGSHSCSGSDSSILLVLSTLGISGLVLFVSFFYEVTRNVPEGSDGGVFLSSISVLLIHSQFNNTLLYPWTIGWILVLGVLAYPSSRSLE